jgi:hypothetical protein
LTGHVAWNRRKSFATSANPKDLPLEDRENGEEVILKLK